MAKCKDCFHWNACKKMLETYWGHCVPSDYEGGADRYEDFISTANVIVLTGIIEGHPDPVGELGDSAIDVAKFEVAREIFSEILNIIRGYSHSACIAKNNYGITQAEYIGIDILKLKNKYTEGKE